MPATRKAAPPIPGRRFFEPTRNDAIIAHVSRVRLHRTEAIVLKRHDFGEADRILTLFTPDRGKVRAIAKGVRRIASRKSGHIELFTHTSVLLAEGRNLYVLTQAETIRPFVGVREDLVRTTYAYHVAEILDRFMEEGITSRTAFDLTVKTLEALAECADPSLAARFFELRFLGLVGYRPQLFHCTSCGESLDPAGNAFSAEAGGMLCPSCHPAARDARPLSDNAFRILRFLQTRDWAVARRITLTPATRGELEGVMHAYVRHLLERDLKSVEFLKGLRQVADSLDLVPVASVRADTTPEGD